MKGAMYVHNRDVSHFEEMVGTLECFFCTFINCIKVKEGLTSGNRRRCL